MNNSAPTDDELRAHAIDFFMDGITKHVDYCRQEGDIEYVVMVGGLVTAAFDLLCEMAQVAMMEDAAEAEEDEPEDPPCWGDVSSFEDG